MNKVENIDVANSFMIYDKEKIYFTISSVSDNIFSTINIHNFIKIILSELFSTNNISLLSHSNKDFVNNINLGLGENKYPGIGLEVKKRIKKWLKDKKDRGLKVDLIIKNELAKDPEVFLSGIIKELNLDFYNPENMGLLKNPNSSKDIPIQAEEASNAGVPSKYNGTIGVLKNSKNKIVSNPRIESVLNQKSSNVNNLLNYQSGVGIESFRKAIEFLIEHEESIYNWPKIKGEVTRPYFIPGGLGGLSIIRDYFLDEGDLVLLPNYRWPNIDGIIINKTKVPPAQIDLIKEKGILNLKSIDDSLQNGINSGRKRITIYLNFPNNPTGVRMNNFNKIELNNILSKYSNEDVKIQIILDDPYGAFNVENNTKNLDSPLSYHIDTRKNVTVFELGSHGTKEAGVYGLRIGVLRVLSNHLNINKIDKVLKTAIRETFSMSPTLPQEVMVKAILGDNIDPFNNEEIEKLSKNYIHDSISKYIEGRNTMLNTIYPKLYLFKNKIVSQFSDYLLPMDNVYNNESQNGGFMICFTLTDKAKKLGLNLKKLQEACINNGKNKCAFTIFDDDINNEKAMRITLIGGSINEYVKRLQLGINKCLIKNSSN